MIRPIEVDEKFLAWDVRGLSQHPGEDFLHKLLADGTRKEQMEGGFVLHILVSNDVTKCECPGTKWAIAILYPAVLLWSLNKKVLVELEKNDLFHELLSFFDSS